MSRLLFAAARGARVQANYQGVWSGVAGIHLGRTPHEYRIHPEDVHLQYGPISSALREVDDNPPKYWFSAITAEIRFGIDSWLDYTQRDGYHNADDLTRSLFLLILAEALADEGL